MTTPRVTVPVEPIQRLILAADSYGVRYLDSDDMSAEAEELQAATEAMKDLIAAPAPEGGAVLQAFADEVARIAITEDTSGDDAFNALNVVVDYARELSKARPDPDDTSGDLHGRLFRNPALATPAGEPSLVDWFSQFIERHQEGCGSDTDALIACLDRVRDSYRAQPQAREDAQPVGWREVFIVDEEDGPVSGICIDMADGSQIWTGECSNALLDGMGDERPDESGQFVMVATKGNPTRVVASVSNVDDGIEIARSLASRIAHPAPDALRVAVEKLLPVARLNTRLGKAGDKLRSALDAVESALQAEQKGGA